MHKQFKASFLLWRALNGKLPTNERLTKFGLEPSKYFYCRNRTGLDTINHIFNNGEIARDVRRWFANGARVEIYHSSMRQLVTQWWSMKHNESH